MIALIAFLLRQSRLRMAWAALTAMVAGLCSTALLAVIQRGLAAGGPPGAPLLAVFGGLALGLAVSRTASEVALARLTQHALVELRLGLGRQILAAPLAELERIGPAQLLAVLTSDVTAITQAMARLPTLLSDVTILVSGLAYLAWLYWPAMVGALIVMVLGVLVFAALGRRAQVRFDAARDHEDRLFEHLGALTRGTKELKLHEPRRRAFLDKILTPTIQAFRASKVSAHAHFAVAASTGQLMFFLLIGALVLATPYVASSVTTGALTGYALVLIYLVIPLDGLTTMGPVMAAATTALARITGLARGFERDVDTAPVARAARSPAWQTLALDGVTHRYRRERDDSEFTLGPIDLALAPGELVFLIGGNGSGKTTLAKLLIGLYRPESGRVVLDGKPVTDAAGREAYRQLFSVVFSDFFLFETMLGLDATRIDAHVPGYLRTLQLDHKVRYEGGALSTLELSSGQRKRLALLTSLLEDRPIYLFDEWAADQDPAYKHVFYTELLPELRARGKTVIAISHDDRYFHLADRLIKMADGRIERDERVGAVEDVHGRSA